MSFVQLFPNMANQVSLILITVVIIVAIRCHWSVRVWVVRSIIALSGHRKVLCGVYDYVEFFDKVCFIRNFFVIKLHIIYCDSLSKSSISFSLPCHTALESSLISISDATEVTFFLTSSFVISR